MGTERRTLLAASAAGAAALVTGCTDGGDGGSGGGGGAEQPTPSAPPATASATEHSPATGRAAASAPAGKTLARTSDIPVGGGKIFRDERVVVTQPAAGEFRAFSAVCPHQNCVVSEVADGMIVCPCHDSGFRVTDASVAKGPATRPLPPQQITVTQDTILLP
ncbi:Rieske (2Fe-2S) protein [Streptomyces sp. NPDC004609]|uniref:Rieske (2Fe-2S) protein n=1 Tax=Streptomyces sp. NPDC004609 TaxID=3364704 RepID=UPI0036CD1215